VAVVFVLYEMNVVVEVAVVGVQGLFVVVTLTWLLM